ncbi:MAG: hypothetical protein RL329_1404, partial [Bacteroidota bacterium]
LIVIDLGQKVIHIPMWITMWITSELSTFKTIPMWITFAMWITFKVIHIGMRVIHIKK